MEHRLALAFPLLDVAGLLRAPGLVSITDGQDAWPDLHAEATRRLVAIQDLPLGTLIPVLTRRGGAIDLTRFQKRTRTTLRRANLSTWRELGSRSLLEIHAVPSAGEGTLNDLMAGCVEYAWEQTGPAALEPLTDIDVIGGEQAAWHSTDQLLRALADVQAWLDAERPGTSLDELLVQEGRLALPPDLRSEFVDAVRWEMPGTAVRPDPDAWLDAAVSALDGRERWILERREIAVPASTLEAIGEHLGLTRERVRQLQARANEKLGASLLAPETRGLRWRAHDLRLALGPMAPLGDPDVDRAVDHALRGFSADRLPLARNLLLKLAGPYREEDGWLLAAKRTVPRPDLLWPTADEHGLIDRATAHALLAEAGICTAHQATWLERNATAIRPLGEWLARWDRDIGSKCVAVLAEMGHPASAEELVAIVGEGHSIRSTKNVLAISPHAIRVSPKAWGLRSWGYDEYSSIAAEITQALEAKGGGPVPLAPLIEQLAQQYDLKPGSVRAFAGAPAFVLSRGTIKLRSTADDPLPVDDDLSRVTLAFRPAKHLVVVAHLVDRDVLRGSGRAIPPNMGTALGVAPGTARTFRSGSAEVRATWPMTSFTGPSIGSTRPFAERVHAVDGDLLGLHFDLTTEEVVAYRIPADWSGRLRPEAALQQLTGLTSQPNLLEALARAVGATEANAEQILTDRGDRAIWDLARSMSFG